MEINFDFACRDDCLAQMVPSDLRTLVAQRDMAREQIAMLESRLSSATQENERLKDESVRKTRADGQTCYVTRLAYEAVTAELAAVKALVPSDHCVVPRSLVVDVMCYGEDGKVLEPWMVHNLDRALLGAYPEAKQPAPAGEEKP